MPLTTELQSPWRKPEKVTSIDTSKAIFNNAIETCHQETLSDRAVGGKDALTQWYNDTDTLVASVQLVQLHAEDPCSTESHRGIDFTLGVNVNGVCAVLIAEAHPSRPPRGGYWHGSRSADESNTSMSRVFDLKLRVPFSAVMEQQTCFLPQAAASAENTALICMCCWRP